MDYLGRFYDICEEAGAPMGLPREQWVAKGHERMLAGEAEIWPIGANGEMIGGVLFFGDTIHVAVLPAWQGRWITKALRRAYDTWTHSIPIRAIVKPDNSKVIELATRLGFKFRQDAGQYHIYVKEPTHA